MSACQVDPCTTGSAYYAKGYCSTHYQRWRRHGDPEFTRVDEWHKLSDVEDGRGVCSKCGPVRVYATGRPGGRICANKQAAVVRNNRYNLKSGWYEAEYERVGGVCPICKEREVRQVDHDHGCCPGESSCGKCVRGLLCADCNSGLGRFHDDPAALLRAARYLGLS